MASIKYKTNEGYVSIPMTVPTKTNAENGNGIGICSTSSGTALTVSLTGYELVQNGFVAVTFANDVPANATLNINSKGAKPIIYKGAAITADTIKADDTVMFAYDGTNYEVISLGGGGSAAGLEIVAASGTTLNAEVGKYYRYDSDVTTLAVTLPTITETTEIQEVVIYFKTGSSNPNITFSGSTIVRLGEFILKKNNKYHINCIWNGIAWVLNVNETAPYDSQLEYLESTGTQWINTGYRYSPTSRREFKVYITGDPVGANFRPIWGANSGGNEVSLGAGVSTTYYFMGKSGNLPISQNTIHEFDISMVSGAGYVKMDGSIVITATGSPNNRREYLFGGIGDSTNNDVTIDSYHKERIYYYRIYESGVLVRDFIPVRNGQTGYMYDKVTGMFFPNEGSGSFILGPDI